MSIVPPEQLEAFVRTIDTKAALRRASVRRTAAPHVLWRGPIDNHFTAYTVTQWRAIACYLVHDETQQMIEHQIAQAHQRSQHHVFCWALPPPVQMPPIGALFFSLVLAWLGDFTPPPAPPAT